MSIKGKKRKFEAEIGTEPKIVAEHNAIKEKKNYTSTHLIHAVQDVSVMINNAYFRTPFSRCPDCNKGNNTILAHFGVGGANKIGNLAGFQITVGDVIAWHSQTYSGISIIKSKNNGVFELETSPFEASRKEPAVVERMIIPEKYRKVIGKMAEFLADDSYVDDADLIQIGGRKYPSAIAKEL